MKTIPQVGDTIRIIDALCKSSVGKVCRVKKIDSDGLAWVCVGRINCGLLCGEFIERLRPEQMELVEEPYVQLKAVPIKSKHRKEK